MGKNCEHLKSIEPGTGHRINGGKSPLPEAKAARDVPHLPGGPARSAGNRATGKRANVAPSMDQGPDLSD